MASLENDFDQIEEEFWSRYERREELVRGESDGVYGDSYYGRVCKARRIGCWKAVVINCYQDSDGLIACTTLGGKSLGEFLVPPGEQPFDTWVAEKIITSMNQPPTQGELHMVDPAGTIFCTQKLDEEFVAIKTIKCPEDEGVPQTALREISAMKQLVHKHVMRLSEVCCFHGLHNRKSLALVCELMDCSLRNYMRARKDCLAPEEVRSFMKQLMVGMDFVHSRGIMHRDLKPQTLCICKSNVLKIGGFQLARPVTLLMRQYTHEVVTTWYRPLEILLGGKMYSLPVDMWSCGCCFAEMASGRPLFPGDSEIGTIFLIFQKLGTPNYATWPGLKELPDFRQTFPEWPPKPLSQIRNLSTQLGPGGLRLLDGLLRYDPAKRISARVALNQFEYLVESP